MEVLTILISAFIGVVAIAVFYGVITSFLGHRKMMNQMTSQIFREAGQRRPPSQPAGTDMTPDKGEYSCTNCGASLESGTEISPSGDFKCRYCNSWSNVNQ